MPLSVAASPWTWLRRDKCIGSGLNLAVAVFITSLCSCQLLRRAARGEVLITSEQFARARRWSQEVGVRWESLTKREREVLEILARGKSNTEIAEALSIEVRTVEMHLTNAMGKLGVASRLEAAMWIRDNLPDDTWKPTG